MSDRLYRDVIWREVRPEDLKERPQDDIGALLEFYGEEKATPLPTHVVKDKTNPIVLMQDRIGYEPDHRQLIVPERLEYTKRSKLLSYKMQKSRYKSYKSCYAEQRQAN